MECRLLPFDDILKSTSVIHTIQLFSPKVCSSVCVCAHTCTHTCVLTVFVPPPCSVPHSLPLLQRARTLDRQPTSWLTTGAPQPHLIGSHLMIFIAILPYLVGMRCVMHGAVELACEHVPGETGRSWERWWHLLCISCVPCGCGVGVYVQP